MKQEIEQVGFQKTEEINLMQIMQFIWDARLWIVSNILIVLLFVYIFVVIKPVKPDTYHVTQMVEIASLQIKTANRTDKPFLIERSRDIVKILPSLTNSSVQFIVPKDTNKVLLLSAVHVDKEQALNQVSKAVEFLKERHARMIASIKDSEIINPTNALNEPKVVFTPFKSKLPKYMVFGVVMGGILGLLMSLIARLVQARKLK
ncbi:MAG: hypothetical protein R3189_04245 [Thiomicrorhabdus chilensis]|uniref:hypothetical protein n=1 Tax=Thiomicrorhabdus chilensis TaxID=63656 RepID=UPI00299F31CC|nr:hypothetical protein [Thiomicrorhabdus chilensis]MDX1347444.1 hypothetical protein [Thiomicrorhabdus chilensis]